MVFLSFYLFMFLYFRYHTIYGMVVIEKTFSNFISTRLPLGDPSTNYEILIEIIIYDSLGAPYMDFIPVTVGFVISLILSLQINPAFVNQLIFNCTV